MPKNVKIDQDVYVLRTLVGKDPDTPVGPFLQTKIREIKGRSVRLDLPPDPLAISGWVGISKLHLRMGILIIRIGDFKEDDLIDPLCKSVLHFCRMLVPGDAVRLVELRTLEELKHFWETLHPQFEQIVLVGHGDKSRIYFGARGVSVRVLVEILEEPNPSAKEFISICCQTGQKRFGKEFSRSSACNTFVAPFHSIRGVVASQFCQTYLTSRILEGRSIGVAFNKAREQLLGTASFRLWQKGKLKAGPK